MELMLTFNVQVDNEEENYVFKDNCLSYSFQIEIRTSFALTHASLTCSLQNSTETRTQKIKHVVK